jgi:hypothetical protein
MPYAEEQPHAKEKYLGKVPTKCAIAISVALQDFKTRLWSKLPATKQSFFSGLARRFETTYCTEIPDGLVVHLVQDLQSMHGDIVIYLIDREDYTIVRRGFDL